jgi:NADH-quinone oxidoreductase subunit M
VTFDHHVLLWLVFLPLAAGIFVGALGPRRGDLVRAVSLGTSLVILVLAFILTGRFVALERHGVHLGELAPGAAPTFHPEFVPGSSPDNRHRTEWDLVPLGPINSETGRPAAVQFYLGVDGISVWLVLLTALLFMPSVLISWTYVRERVNEFFAWLLVLQTCMMGIFVSFDILLFYVFFELSLVPLFFLIGIWGGPQRQYAARKFFLYTLTGSLLTLLGVLAVVQACQEKAGVLTFSIPHLVELVHKQLASPGADQGYWLRLQNTVFLLLAAGFAVKVPLFPFHTWLPLAHVEAPTAGSVDLAGILLKVGAYGFLRLAIPLAPDVSLSLGLPLVTTLAAIGIVYGAWCAYSQEDVKRLVAYSSISHLGLAMLAMFALNMPGLEGSLMQLFNHGLSTGALFLLIGMIYERYHTRRIGDFGGMAVRMPLFAVFFIFMCLSSAGLPGLNGFIGEFLCLSGIAQHESRCGVLTVVAASGLVWGAWYLFTMARRLLFGPLKEPHVEEKASGDLKVREWLLLVPPVVMCVIIGVYPRPILDAARPDLETVVDIADHARERVGLPPATTPRRGGAEAAH